MSARHAPDVLDELGLEPPPVPPARPKRAQTGDPMARAPITKSAAAPKRKTSRPALSEHGGVAMTEDAFALQFAAEYCHEFRWTPGMGWMENRGDHWTGDDQLRRFDTVRGLCREHAVAAGEPREAARLSSAKIVAAVLSLAQSDERLSLPASAWDADRFALNTPEGIVDLRTGRLRGRGGWVDDFFTQVTRISPAAGPCPTWRDFIDAVFVGDAETIEFVQRLLGYLLSADRSEQKVFFFFGLGANGKSTLIDLVAWILGTYALKMPAAVLMQSNIDRHPTELAQLRGKRLAVSSELDEGQFWAESRIKELTGDEVLTARFMRQDFFEFVMTQTHVIVGNYKPRLRGGDAALARRFVLVPFLAKFEGAERDPEMLTKLRSEAPAILAWMVEGAVKWRGSGLQIPASVTLASREYLAENDDIALWLAECCLLVPDARAKASQLYESFASWIKARGQHAPSARLFGDRMGALPGVTKLQSNGIRYVGVRLTEDESARVSALHFGVTR